MRVIKSDGRRKFYREGFYTVLEFDVDFRDRVFRNRVRDYFIERFGKPYNYSLFEHNPNWRSKMHHGTSRRSKIYLKDEQEVTLMLLSLEQ